MSLIFTKTVANATGLRGPGAYRSVAIVSPRPSVYRSVSIVSPLPAFNHVVPTAFHAISHLDYPETISSLEFIFASGDVNSHHDNDDGQNSQSRNLGGSSSGSSSSVLSLKYSVSIVLGQQNSFSSASSAYSSMTAALSTSVASGAFTKYDSIITVTQIEMYPTDALLLEYTDF